MALDETVHCDVVVVGSGAGGLSAAVTARKGGIDVMVVEKEPLLGGTTAISAGGMWIPCNAPAERAGFADSLDDARTYIRQETGVHFDAARVEMFLENGPRMIAFFEREFGFEFSIWAVLPDYHPQSPGASLGGRAISAAPIDGRVLGSWVRYLRPPLPEVTLFGGLPVRFDSFEMKHFINALRSPASAWYVTRRLARYARDRLLHGRNMLMVNGGALVTRLVKAALDLGIPIWLSSPARTLIIEDGIVRGIVVSKDGRDLRILARRGVILAAGGFPHDIERRRRLYVHAAGVDEHFPLAPAGNTGDGLHLAETAGGGIDDRYVRAAALFTASRNPLPHGGRRTVPNPSDRAKPGAIAVTSEGRRFTNESNSYHDVMAALLEVSDKNRPASGFVICDHRAIRRYGLGIAKPAPLPLGPYLRSGYILRESSIEALAQRLGIEPSVLGDTVAQFNAQARQGSDPHFGRGENAYNRSQGDPTHKPNASLAPLEIPPYYAVKLVPGDLGTFAGLRTDQFARVLDGTEEPIPGLYAVGNDMASIFGGVYLAGGCTLGPAMTFGYVAGIHLAKENARHSGQE